MVRPNSETDMEMSTENEQEEEEEIKDQILPIDDPRFGPYLRLFKYNVLDILLADESGRLFDMYEGIPGLNIPLLKGWLLQPDKTFDEYLKKFPDGTDMGIMHLDKDKFPNQEEFDKASMRRTDRINVLKQQELRDKQTSAAEIFLRKALYSEKGIRVTDQILEARCENIYLASHFCKGTGSKAIQKFSKTFFAKFFVATEPPKSVADVQHLDRIAAAFDGERVMRAWKHANHDEEFGAVATFLTSVNDIEIKNDFLKRWLRGGYTSKSFQNEPNPTLREWNRSKSLSLLAALPYMICFTCGKNDLKHFAESDAWYYRLIEAMSHDPDNRAVLMYLHPDWSNTLAMRQQQVIAARRRRLDSNSAMEMAVDKNSQVKEMRPQPQRDLRSEVTNDDGLRDELVLRGYQEELVAPALRDLNVVIVAPTGSGKTEVGIYAAMKHVEKRTEQRKPSRVVMVVPKIALVKQQSERFNRYCYGTYKVDWFHGSEDESGEGRSKAFIDADIVVMTPQILLNMLVSVRSNERLYVCDISLLIIDEVHKATGKHAYAQLASIIDKYDGPRPQVVGMTASLNVTASSTVDQGLMLSEIYKLLAVVDAATLSTVKIPANLAELEEHVPKPDDDMVMCNQLAGTKAQLCGVVSRQITALQDNLKATLENLAKKHKGFVFQPKKQTKPNKLDVQMMENWLNVVFQALTKLNSAEKADAFLQANYLKTFIDAYNIGEVMPASVAWRFLIREVDELERHGRPEIVNVFNAARESLQSVIQEGGSEDPDIVTKLKEELQTQFQKEPNSRAIIFVEQRATAVRVSEFLNETGVLNNLPGHRHGRQYFAYVLGSSNSHGNAAKQTTAEQTDVLTRFRNGEIKAIVATSVVEEGLDVAACNLIIKYNCSGSAITLIQRRGCRARARGARSVLLAVTNSVHKMENEAKIAEKNMRHCVQLIERDGEKALLLKVKEVKARMENERQMQENERKQRRMCMSNKIYRVNCKTCNDFLCLSKHIKKIYSNYVIMDPDIWQRVQLEMAKHDAKWLDLETVVLCSLKCKKGHPLGKVFKTAGVYVPQLKVDEVSFDLDQSDDMITKKKWIDVEQELFFVDDYETDDLVNMLNALTSYDSLWKDKLDEACRQRTQEVDRQAKIEADKAKRSAMAAATSSQMAAADIATTAIKKKTWDGPEKTHDVDDDDDEERDDDDDDDVEDF